MDWNKAFDITLEEFRISATWLSERSGVSQQSISKFRRGRSPMTTDNLNALLLELPFEARERFFALVLGASISPVQAPIEEQIETLSKESKKKLVMTLVESLVHDPVTPQLSKSAV